MEDSIKYRKGMRRKIENAFNPGRDVLKKAIKDFIKRGGKITKIREDNFTSLINPYRSSMALSVDDIGDSTL